MDSACSRHMTGDKSKLSSFTPKDGGFVTFGDNSRVLNYDPKLDSVLQVTVEDYKVCSRSNPIKSYTDGNTTISLDHSGAFYFISGAKGHCEEGQKLEVRVLSAKHAPRAHPPATSPVSAPVPAPAPSPYPAEIIPPVTAPSGGASGLKVGVCVGVVGVLGSLVGLAFVM
ncbi:mavicyanin-like isoform X2 [Actinidia eriantha]|uniref:mavicyanin-like isoform X2 n=1 Tax=Actinidia eriantha TaxID=165200 RepID=UPI00258CBBF3|nr:mavicyanin-like isoform X2 [Actinidia eriantha]